MQLASTRPPIVYAAIAVTSTGPAFAVDAVVPARGRVIA
jgi:hypothetical protein